MSTDNNIISFNIKRERNNKGFTQKEMAEKLDVTEQTYKRIENNPVKRPLEDLEKIANVIGCDKYLFFLNSSVTDSNKT